MITTTLFTAKFGSICDYCDAPLTPGVKYTAFDGYYLVYTIEDVIKKMARCISVLVGDAGIVHPEYLLLHHLSITGAMVVSAVQILVEYKYD